MRDEHDDRMYQASRQDLNAGITRLLQSIAYAFERLHAQLYAAPWSVKDKGADETPRHRPTIV